MFSYFDEIKEKFFLKSLHILKSESQANLFLKKLQSLKCIVFTLPSTKYVFHQNI